MPGQALMHGNRRSLGTHPASLQPAPCLFTSSATARDGGNLWHGLPALQHGKQWTRSQIRIPRYLKYSFPSFGCLCSGSALLQHSIRKGSALGKGAVRASAGELHLGVGSCIPSWSSCCTWLMLHRGPTQPAPSLETWLPSLGWG